MTHAFGLEFDPTVVAAIAAHGERDYPTEACGVVVGAPSSAALARVEPLRNVQDRYHQRDPARFTRTGRDAFRMDELERMRLLERIEAAGLTERIIYHSHCDVGAYFSPEDRAMAVVDGMELLPGVVHVVVSVIAGRATAMAAFRYDAERGRFDEQRVPLTEPAPWPDFEARAMTGRAASRPIRPVGGRLVRRRVSAVEQASVARVAVTAVEVEATDVVELRRFGLGLWSPLAGFAQDGAEPWWPRAAAARPDVPAGSIVELRRLGVAVGALRVDGGPRLAGEVVTYPATFASSDVDPADVRAEIVRRGGVRVTARVGPSSCLELDVDGARLATPTIAAAADVTVQAIWAQNLGATHLRAARSPEAADLDITVEPAD